MKIFSISVRDIDDRLEALQKTAVEAAAVSTDDINFQMNKTNKAPTDPKTVVSEKYHDFLNVFSKEALDTVTEHCKYDHRIRPLKGHKNLG